jgi:hypothetical protein
MLERVIITVQGDSEQVLVDCHWAGGMRTQHELRRPVQRLTQLRDHAALLERLRELHADGQRAPAIAGILNTEGWRPPKRRATYTAAMVRELLHRIGVAASARSSLADRLQDRAPDELTIRELATRLGAPSVTIHRWVTRGEVTARKVPVLTHSLWLIRVDDAELQRLRQRRSGGTRHSVNPNEV